MAKEKEKFEVEGKVTEVIKRKGKVMVICENPKHKQKQG